MEGREDAQRTANEDAGDEDEAGAFHQTRAGHWLSALRAETEEHDADDQKHGQAQPDKRAHRPKIPRRNPGAARGFNDGGDFRVFAGALRAPRSVRHGDGTSVTWTGRVRSVAATMSRTIFQIPRRRCGRPHGPSSCKVWQAHAPG
jgi:hypothetical protein